MRDTTKIETQTDVFFPQIFVNENATKIGWRTDERGRGEWAGAFRATTQWLARESVKKT